MSTQELILIFGMAIVTFACRYPVLALVSRIPLPARVLKAMRYIPPAVLTAIIAPAVLMPQGRIEANYQNGYLVAGVVAALIAWRSKNLLLTIVAGMAFFLLWRYFVYA
jgi:branched-subunit amino acid transport protein